MKIGFIGAGNMGGAILRGYAPHAAASDHKILVYGPNQDKRKALERELDVVTACNSVGELVQQSQMILLGVKPNILPDVLEQVKADYTAEKTVVSMAAGVSIASIEAVLGEDAKVIRIMPNTPAQVSEAMISVSCNKNTGQEDRASAMAVFRAIGRAEEVDEELIHCVIGISGSSPAYTYMYIDALIQAAKENGMPEEEARIFAAQSVLGAAKMVLESDLSPEQLRINVCSPGGTTIEAVNTLLAEQFEETVKKGFQAAVDRSKSMTKQVK